MLPFNAMHRDEVNIEIYALNVDDSKTDVYLALCLIHCVMSKQNLRDNSTWLQSVNSCIFLAQDSSQFEN